MAEEQKTRKRECPRGRFPGRLDDKGRVKLSAALQEYFGGLEEKTLFVTSIDRRTAQIYTLEVWRENEKTLAEQREHSAAARKMIFNASDLGSETEMDNQGRVLFSPDLRRELGLENQPVQLITYRRHIEVMSEQAYATRKAESSDVVAKDIEMLETAGLN